MPTTKKVFYKNGVEYSLPSHVKFVADMTAAGIPIELRKTHVGSSPCVRVTDKDVPLNATTVRCDWNAEDREFIIYPLGLDPNLTEQQKYSWGR